MSRRTRAAAFVAPLALLALLTAACSNGGSSTASRSSGAAPSPASSSASTTTTAPTSTSAASTTTPACTDAPPPAAAVRSTSADADVDGDGKPDTVNVAGTGTDAAPGPWQVTVALAAGGRRAAVVADADPVDVRQAVRVLGVATIGTTPTVFVVTGTGASTSIVGLFQLVGCQLVRVTIGATRPATFAIGGTVTHLDGLRCEPSGALTILTATSADGVTYDATVRTATITAGVLEAPAGTTQQLPGGQLDGYGQLACPGVEPL